MGDDICAFPALRRQVVRMNFLAHRNASEYTRLLLRYRTGQGVKEGSKALNDLGKRLLQYCKPYKTGISVLKPKKGWSLSNGLSFLLNGSTWSRRRTLVCPILFSGESRNKS
jgi:hypothetical protein